MFIYLTIISAIGNEFKINYESINTQLMETIKLDKGHILKTGPK